MNKLDIEKKARELRNWHGGSIFAFPINEEDPFSKYAVVTYMGGMYHIFPETSHISEAAAGVMAILEESNKRGYSFEYARDVRFISHQAQMDAPDVTMRRLKKQNKPTGFLTEGVDVTKKQDGEDGYLFSGRGLIKFTYLSMVDDKMPKAIQFMKEYYKLLAMRKYGKTAAAIKQEVRRMTKDEGVRWIEQTYSRYIRDDMEVMNIMQNLKKGG